MSAIAHWHMREARVAINDAVALTAFLKHGGFVDEHDMRVVRKTMPHRFELTGRLSNACWTMWKMIASGQIHGAWTFTAMDAADDSYIAFNFAEAADCAYARLIAGNDDRPEDGWVPEDLFGKEHA